MIPQTDIFTNIMFIYTHIQIYTFRSYDQAHLLATAVDLSGIGFICGNEMGIIAHIISAKCTILHVHWPLFVSYILFFLYLFFSCCYSVFILQAAQLQSPKPTFMLLCLFHHEIFMYVRVYIIRYVENLNVAPEFCMFGVFFYCCCCCCCVCLIYVCTDSPWFRRYNFAVVFTNRILVACTAI